MRMVLTQKTNMGIQASMASTARRSHFEVSREGVDLPSVFPWVDSLLAVGRLRFMNLKQPCLSSFVNRGADYRHLLSYDYSVHNN